mgnify:CR=1 FL=1
MWARIKQLTNQHGYMSGTDRMSDRVKKTGEIFTPTDLVIEMLQHLDIEGFAPGKTVIDPACGDGQFLVVVKWIKVLHFNMTEEEALKDLFGVDIMRDNVDLCKKRLGGGTIIMGDTLNPYAILPQQTEQEQILMEDMFGDQMTLKRFMY